MPAQCKRLKFNRHILMRICGLLLATVFAYITCACIVQSAFAVDTTRANAEYSALVNVDGKKFVQDGREVILNGLNYFPAYFPAITPESWLNDDRYRPEIVEDDLTTIRNLGVNLVSIYAVGAGSTPDTKTCANIHDFLDRAHTHGLLVNMYIGTSTLMPINKPSSLAIFPKACALAGHPALFAYDIAWEPHFGDETERQALQAGWLTWLENGYGALTEADRVFGGNHALPTDRELCGETSSVKVAAFRRFLDDILSASYRKVRAAILAVDDTHLIGVRSGYGGNGSRDHCKYAPVDLRAAAKYLDFVSPEGYALSLTNSSELMDRGQFTAAYADVGKPVFWAEYGSNTDGSCANCKEDVQEKLFSNIYAMMRKSDSNGGAGWWFVGIRPQSHADSEKSDYGIVYDYMKEATAWDAFNDPLRAGELSLCTDRPSEYSLHKTQGGKNGIESVCPSGLKPLGRFKTASVKKPSDPSWLTLCGADDGMVLAVTYDDATGENFRCPQGYVSAGSFKPEPYNSGTGVSAMDAFGRSISSGWLTLCARNNHAVLKRTWNEMSGRSISCPAGFNKSGSFSPASLPLFRPVARILKGALSGVSAAKRNYSNWITVDRDAAAGDWKMYDIGTRAYAAQTTENLRLGVRTMCAGSTSKEVGVCVGNILNNGSCPPKCLNAELMSIEIQNAQGRWEEVANGGSVIIAAGAPVRARLIAGNTGEGKWLTHASAGGVSGSVNFGCNENVGDLGCRKSINTDTAMFGDSASGEFVISQGLTKKTTVVFQMVAELVAWFGERARIVLVPH